MKTLLLTMLAAVALSGATASICAAADTADAPKAASAIPEDVAKFASDFSEAMSSQDPDRVMTFYSKRYLHDGANWKGRQQYVIMIAPKIQDYKLTFTDFKPIDKNRAYISANSVSASFANTKGPDYQIVREHGKWLWLGNQRKTPRKMN